MLPYDSYNNLASKHSAGGVWPFHCFTQAAATGDGFPPTVHQSRLHLPLHIFFADFLYKNCDICTK